MSGAIIMRLSPCNLAHQFVVIDSIEGSYHTLPTSTTLRVQ
jgi:hypothetical protein